MTVTPPVKIVIDFLDGITQKKDATAYARGFIESHFDVPSLCGYYVMPMGNGYVYEAHEGGSQRAYLPRIMKMIKDNPTMTISVRAGKRVLQISRGAKDSFNAVLLPEELSSYLENVIDPEEEGPSLIPYETPALVWMVTGGFVALLGGLILLASFGFFIFDRLGDKPPQYALMPADQLPMRQWDALTKSVEPGGYVAALRYANGAWSSDIKTPQQAAEEKQAKKAKADTEQTAAGSNPAPSAQNQAPGAAVTVPAKTSPAASPPVTPPATTTPAITPPAGTTPPLAGLPPVISPATAPPPAGSAPVATRPPPAAAPATPADANSNDGVVLVSPDMPAGQ